MIWHSTSAAEVLSELGVDDKRGLPNGVAEMRLQQYGKNVISSIEKPSYLKRFSEQLKNRMVIFLVVTAVVSFIVSLMYGQVNNYSPLLIIGIVIANAAVSAYQLHNCDNALDSMKSYTNPTVSVLREGIVKPVNSALLVPGDIIILEEGDYVPADARIIECNEFRCNEAQITGSEIPVEKNAQAELEDITAVENRSNMVFTGTSVVHGSAKAVVTATGLHTEIGHTSAILQQTGENALPLENELDTIGKTVNTVILIICAVTFVIGMIQNFSSGNFADMTLKSLMNSVALAVAAIPEGLPAIATVVIAVGVKRIVHNNIIVKDSAALETLGRTNVICADKTGVFTRNKMELVKIFDGDKLTDIKNEPLDEKTALVLRLAAACSTLKNDSTEDAVKKACLTYNSMSQKDIDSFFPQLAVIPFDSERKTMTVITMINEKPFAIVKGAAENVVPYCGGCDGEKILKLNENLADE
ncbi:MAG TPA: ATPase, partial [Ruminococcaceae bacterium]|nr:ATPase [Oscillospiraceae bacterium]